MTDETKTPFLVGAVVLTLMAAFLYTAHEILSPILIGMLLVFILAGLRDNEVAGRLSTAVWLLLILWVFIRAQVVFFPFLAAFALAYILDPAVDFLERRKMKRGLASLILILVVFGVIVTMGILLIPKLILEIQNFINSLPKVVDSIQTKMMEIVPKLLRFFRIEETQFKENWTDTVPMGLQQIFNNLLKGVLSLTAFLGQILNIIIIPVLTFYLLKDFNKIRTWLLTLFPRKRRPRVSYYLWRLNRIVGGYLRAQVIVSIFVGFMTGTFLALAGIQFAVLLGVLAGLLNFIPFIGLYVGLTITALVAFLDPNPMVALLKVGVVYALVQGAEGTVIQPKIVGDRVGLHPVAVMFSVLFFARFFGFWGLLIGVPTAAVVFLFIDEWKRKQALLELIEEKALKHKQ